MAAHQAHPSLGFSRQEHWSGLPFPSPMHESEKWKWSYSVMSDSLWPHGLQPTRLLRPWDFPGKSTGVGCQSPHSKNIVPLRLLWMQQSILTFVAMEEVYNTKCKCISLLGLLSQNSTDWMLRQILIFLQFWSLEVWGQGVSSLGFS